MRLSAQELLAASLFLVMSTIADQRLPLVFAFFSLSGFNFDQFLDNLNFLQG